MCLRDAPGVEQFAREHADEVKVIGLGALDSVEQAVEFAERGGTHSFPMYWDESLMSWQAFGIRTQHAAALLSPTGEILGGWEGAFDEDAVLRALAESDA